MIITLTFLANFDEILYQKTIDSLQYYIKSQV